MIHYAEMMKSAWDRRSQDRRCTGANRFDTSERQEDPESPRAWWHEVRGYHQGPHPPQLS